MKTKTVMTIIMIVGWSCWVIALSMMMFPRFAHHTSALWYRIDHNPMTSFWVPISLYSFGAIVSGIGYWRSLQLSNSRLIYLYTKEKEKRPLAIYQNLVGAALSTNVALMGCLIFHVH